MAILSGLSHIASALIRHGANVNAACLTTHNVTLLMLTAYDKNIEITRELIECGADVNAKDKDDWTPLRYAVDAKNTEMCQLLVNAGADTKVIAQDGSKIVLPEGVRLPRENSTPRPSNNEGCRRSIM
jgi:ankyrin repeat protein